MRFSEPQKQRKIAQIEAFIAQGMIQASACKKAKLGHATYSRWKKEAADKSAPTVVTYDGAVTKKRKGRLVGSKVQKNPTFQKMAAVVGTPEQIAAFLKGAL